MSRDQASRALGIERATAADHLDKFVEKAWSTSRSHVPTAVAAPVPGVPPSTTSEQTFHRLAREYTELICNMNLALMRGLLEARDVAGNATLDPAADRCCVAFDV